ncbi:MAG TPA: hypothetical protein VFL59_00245 [Candidatus Nanopelagicales bacterium]|nr:hypothetical protein [Candidatus Nanopelagicales bacterium]
MASDLRAPQALTRAPEAQPAPRPALPAWPFLLLFAGFPVFWVLGLSAFAVQICAIPMAVLLMLRGGVRFPRIFWFWIAFVTCTLASAIMLDSTGRAIGYGVRVSSFVGSTIVFLYVYNATQGRLTDRRLLAGVSVFFTTVVVGGWLGILVPKGRIETLTSKLLPQSIASNGYVDALVRPQFAEVQTPYGSPITFNRPSAPFAYTNGWGVNYAVMVFFAFAMIVAFRSLLAKLVIVALLVASLAPAYQTGNRGMMLAILVFIVYGVLRLALRRHPGPLVTLLVGGGVAALLLGPVVLGALQARLAYSDSNATRAGIYAEAFQGALAHPLIGNGAPRPSTTGLQVSVGTQGQIWNVMFSYGFLALALFVLWFAAAAWCTRRPIGSARLWLHVAACVPLLAMVYYGFDGIQLCAALVAAAVALRPPDGDDEPGSPAPGSALTTV